MRRLSVALLLDLTILGANSTSIMARLVPSIPLDDALVGIRVLWSLPAFLRHPLNPQEALAIVRRRLERREADFLDLVRRTIYPNRVSPYRKLLRLAGCEYGDLERLVGREGVEGALRILFCQGVYLTVDEFKGRRPVVRGSATLAANPSQLRNPYSATHMLRETSGSRGPSTPVPADLAWIRERAVNSCLRFDACGGIGWVHARWGVPGSAVLRLLEYYCIGASSARWFSQVDPAAPGLHPRYRWSARFMHWGGLLAGVRLPRPVFVPLEDPLPVARWMAGVLREGRTPHLQTFPSSASRLCLAAMAAGIDLRGAQFTVGGEPFTAARLAVIRQAGAGATPHYGSEESGRIGNGCLAPGMPDELHLVHDLIALIQPGPDGESRGLPPDALLISSLRRTAPLILLNTSVGDQAAVAQRACGCPLERVGWATHLHSIRSFQKLTAGGMTFLDSDVIRVLEEELPARFGGGPTHYQLVEDEAADGKPLLRLLVHPTVGPIDTEAVADAFLGAIGGGSGVERVMELHWRQAGLLQVERQPPLATASGKILHLHLGGRPQAGRAPDSRSGATPV